MDKTTLDLTTAQEEALASLDQAQDEAGLQQWRNTVLGRKGWISEALKGLGKLPPAERPMMGQRVNEVKTRLEAAYDQAEARLKAQALAASLASEAVDVTLPGRPAGLGGLHLTTRTIREMCAIFADMGFQVYRSPNVETDDLNFTLLNLPPHHPARDMQDTFHVKGNEGRVVLRTQTSPGQIRAMREYHPEPIRIVVPGMVFRYEQVTVRSEMQFHQVEGLAVGKHITMADLKGTIRNFAARFFGSQYDVRFRPSYFPFTEPSMEVDIECIVCGGVGCRICKHSGWLEILGSGMVHPDVLRNGGYDPDIYSGFAWGMGVERPAILKYRIDDIRLFYANDLRFLEQYA
ncbi:MAG: phenylalanine--tRNA ligase subunit alpha [Anaerolineae bacterium]|nr:phenylalanine--tRNA ligase subunit alpha [Anaerolineae bacterium]